VTVTFTHGFVEVPSDIVNLCADLAKLGIESVGQEIPAAGVVSTSVTVGGTSESTTYATEARTLMELPDVTKAWLAQRFGGGVYVTGELK
jgi:hypothetical protein